MRRSQEKSHAGSISKLRSTAGAEWVNAHLGDQDYLHLVASYTKTDEKLLAKMVVGKQPTEIDIAGIERLVLLMKDNDLLKTNLTVASKIFKS